MILGIVASNTRPAGASATVGDPFYDQVVLNMHFDASDGSTTFTDQKGHAFTRTGLAQIDTAQSMFGGSSLLLDGTDDFLTSPDSGDWAFGSGDFTIDCWVRFNGDPGAAGMTFVSQWDATGNDRGWIFGLNNNTLRFVYSTDGIGNTILSTAWDPVTATWYYVSVVRRGPTVYFFVNGTLLGTGTIGTASIFDSATTLQIGTQSNGADFDMNGWMDDVRITRAARYTTTFSRPHQAHYDNLGVPGDELYDKVVSMLHLNGADGSVAFTDSKGITWAATGDPEIDTAQSVFGGSSMHLDGGDWLDATNAAFAWGTGDFTMEAWVRYDTRSGNNFIWTFGGGWGVYTFGGTWAVFDGASSNPILGGTVADDTWYHVAVCRHSGTLRLFVDGVLIGSAANSTNFSNQAVRIGAQPSGVGTMTGWVDDFRATNVARYVGTFQPPVLQNPDRLGDRFFDSVVALLHMDGADGSTTFTDLKGHTFTPTGATISTAQAKFAQSARFPFAQLISTSQADFGLTTSDYTVEFFMRADHVAGTQAVFDMRPFGVGGAGPMMALVNNRFDVYLASAYRVQAGVCVALTWHHFAITRRRNITKVFVDGVQIGSDFTDTTNYPSSMNVLLGRFSDSGSFNFTGYMDDFRLSRGVARYINNFAPPSAAHPDTF